MTNVRTVVLAITLSVIFAGAAMADEIMVYNDIETSTEWTADNVYNLQDQIYVKPGASLTINAGTLVQSTAGLGGSLAVCRGAEIHVMGTAEAPVIMTSTNDDLENWHEGCNEWGNLTIMGNALISASHYGGLAVGDNTKMPTGENEKQMEGLQAAAGLEYDPNVMYGGNDDDDDSGELHYLSLRYGGKVIEMQNELNGLSMGGIGRETEVDHLDIMNNVDDGIETWGGTVNYKYVSIWNIGDDSMDIDEGWRGKAQFGLIVQGYSIDAAQGSGVGDNCIETDGAEDSDAQPVSTAPIYNFTVIGQPVDGDRGTAWRDNARIQYRNCVFMDLGEELVGFDNIDTDGAQGYGYNGTLSWEDTWTTPYAASLDYDATINAMDPKPAAGAFNSPEVLYQSQTSGYLAEMSDCVFYRNNAASAYTQATARGVFDGGMNNVLATESPIRDIDRDAPVVRGGKTMVQVSYLDPRAANDALTSVNAAPDDGFFTPAQYRGAFDGDTNWLAGWSAAAAYGILAPTAAPIAGDRNGDGFVGQADLDIILGSWGQNVAPGSAADASGDGFVGQADLDIVLGTWGQGQL